MTHRTPPHACPLCGYLHTAASAITESGSSQADPVPKPGDVSVCIGCGVLLQFGAELELIKLSQQDVAKLPPDVRRTLLVASKAVLALRRRRGKGATG